MPTVSIVTPSFNQGNFIEKTILSVLSQDYQDIEYIIMDAKSSDSTSAILQKYSHKISRIIEEADDGQADAVCKGLSLCTGEIMAYLNADDCYANAKVISHAVRTFAEHPEVDVLFGKRQFIDEHGYYIRNNPFREFDSEALLRDCFIPQECVFWRRSIYERAGNMVDKKFQFAMDYDLWLRFRHANATFVAVNEAYGLFRVHSEQKTNTLWKTTGLKEVAELQSKYLGRKLSEEEIMATDDAHMFKAEKSAARAFAASQNVWQCFVDFKKNCLSDAPIDQWWQSMLL